MSLSSFKFVTFDDLFSEYSKNSDTMMGTEGEFYVAFWLLWMFHWALEEISLLMQRGLFTARILNHTTKPKSKLQKIKEENVMCMYIYVSL